MAQLISLANPTLPNQQPYVPGYQFWATYNARNRIPRAFSLQLSRGNFPAPQQSIPTLWKVTVLGTGDQNGSAPGPLNGVSVVLTIAGFPVAFLFADDGSSGPLTVSLPTPPPGADAAACASALANQIAIYLNSIGLIQNGSEPGWGIVPLAIDDVCYILATDPSLRLRVSTTDATKIQVNGNNGRAYGDMLLHRAWRAMVFQNIDPLHTSPVSNLATGGTGPDVALPMFPLAIMGPKAWPGQVQPVKQIEE